MILDNFQKQLLLLIKKPTIFQFNVLENGSTNSAWLGSNRWTRLVTNWIKHEPNLLKIDISNKILSYLI